MPVKTSLITLFLAGAAACSVHAQSAPVGGPDARGNSPIKHAHTINAGSATPGANSFTQSQARRHIEHLGYTDVSALTKGKDGVWRGTAMRGGLPVDVALDFKGNVTQAVANAGTQPAPMTSAPAAPMASAPTSPTAGPAETSAPVPPAAHHHHRRHGRRHHHGAGCLTNPGPNGVACSGRDRNRNGISDKEDRAIHAGAEP